MDTPQCSNPACYCKKCGSHSVVAIGAGCLSCGHGIDPNWMLLSTRTQNHCRFSDETPKEEI